jgi:hypothetical protein
VADDLADLSEVERRLFPKRSDTWTPDDWFTFFATAQRLADQYGKEHIVAMVDELLLVGTGPTKEMADAIRHSIRP